MVGGDAAVLDTARPALEPFAGLIVHAGGPGVGQVVKLCNQLVYAAQMLAVSEAATLAVKEGVDLDVVAGEIHGLIGPNGAGKTTLLGLLLQLAAPDSGTLEILDKKSQ